MLLKMYLPSGVSAAVPQDESLDVHFLRDRLHISITIVAAIMNIQFCVLAFARNIIFQAFVKESRTF